MDERDKERRSSFSTLGIMVCLASILVGGFFGFVAALGYQPSTHGYTWESPSSRLLFPVGDSTGVLGGLIAGLLWCRVMFRKALSGEPDEELVGAGVKWGVLAGAATTGFLHVVLLITACVLRLPINYETPLILVSIGLICGVVAGGVVGCLSGVACKSVAQRAPSHGCPADVPPPGK